MPWTRRHLLTLEDLTLAEIEQVHATAAAFKRTLTRSVKKVPALRGKTIVNLFLEPSTRTRMAFTMAAKRLSADVISLDGSSSSTTKDELQATALNVLNVIDWLNPSRLTPASLAHQCVDCNKYHPLKRIK